MKQEQMRAGEEADRAMREVAVRNKQIIARDTQDVNTMMRYLGGCKEMR